MCLILCALVPVLADDGNATLRVALDGVVRKLLRSDRLPSSSGFVFASDSFRGRGGGAGSFLSDAEVGGFRLSVLVAVSVALIMAPVPLGRSTAFSRTEVTELCDFERASSP